MPDVTAQFRQLVYELDPDSSESADGSATGRQTPLARGGKAAVGKQRSWHPLLPPIRNAHPLTDNVLKEAYAVAGNIHCLRLYLLAIRKGYLDTSRHGTLTAQHKQQKIDLLLRSVPVDPTGKSWLPSVLHVIDKQYTSLFDTSLLARGGLTDKDRDDVDYESKTFIARCRERVNALEALLKREEQKYKYTTAERETLLRTLLMAPDGELTSAQRARIHNEIVLMHYGGVVWLLNKWLVDVSSVQRGMQERRLQKELDRLALASPMPPKLSVTVPKPSGSLGRSFLSPLSTSSSRSSSSSRSMSPPPETPGQFNSTRAPFEVTRGRNGVAGGGEDDNEDDNTDDQLTAQERLQFEAENQALLSHFEDTLDEAKKAEQSLLTIAQMQTELAQHLYAQQSTIETLYDQAVLHTDNVREGNVHVSKATDAARGHRFWVVFILLVLSGVLLFLDWYAS
ncbi:hypothetical protein RI367_006039 [Sorochytrium milnesiophthora]